MSGPSISQSERLIVRQIRSSIGVKPKHRGTLRALGLRRIGASNSLPNRPEIRGMIARVRHLITVEDEVGVSGEDGSSSSSSASDRKKA